MNARPGKSRGRYAVTIRPIGAKSAPRLEFALAGNSGYAVYRLIETGLLDPRTEEVVSVEEVSEGDEIEVLA